MDARKPKSKFKPLVDLHRDIGLRFGMLRRLEKVKQSDLARWLGLTSDAISNIESARVPLKLNAGWKACKLMLMHPDFLMNGKQKPFPELKSSMERWISGFCSRHGTMPFGDSWPSIAWAANAPLDQQEALVSKMQGGTPEGVAEINFENSENVLTDVSLKGNNAGVKSEKSEIEKLIEDVKRKAAKPGAKAELARKLDVAPARISEWLSGKKEPGGDYALRLQKWVGPSSSK